MGKHVDTAMIMAAGKGTRMMPLTADCPKPLIEVGGIALLDHVLDHLRDAGIGKIVVNVHYLAEQVEQHLAASASDLNVRISDERDLLRDTGGGLVRALPIISDDPFLCVNADNWWTNAGENAISRLMAAWDDDHMDVLMLLIPLEVAYNSQGMGDFNMEENGRLLRRHGDAPAKYVWTGIQMLSKRLIVDPPADVFSTKHGWRNIVADNISAPRVHVFNVPLGNDLCDVTAQWVLQSAGADPLAISNNILLLPNNRAIKSMTEAFVRQAAPGMLLPRMVAVGDMQLDEALGPMLDPIDADITILPAIGSFDRLMLLAKLVNDHKPRDATLSPAEALRLARKLADLIDELEVDLVDFTQIQDIAIDADLAGHWQSAYGQLLLILPAYHAALSARKLMGPAERRNHLLAALERRLAENMVESPIIAVGITTSAKAVARVLRRVALMPNGHVILPGVDLALSDERWDDLTAATDDAQGFGRRRNVEVHPQFHLKHLLELLWGIF